MEDEETEVVNLVACGSADWPRFLIYHRERDLFWNKGRWRAEWRNGDMWNNPIEAEFELEHARAFANQHGLEDE